MTVTQSSALQISVVIPTYCREKVLIDTIRAVRELKPLPDEVIVVDQSKTHDSDTLHALLTLEGQGAIHWVRLAVPSIPHAMNVGLLNASREIVLFLDDDIMPEVGLLRAHLIAHRETGAALVAGRVIQPWQVGIDYSGDETFHFASLKPQWSYYFMGCNFSVRRDIALALGGFDENFVHVAYRFEAEFADRAIAAGERIFFEPEASIRHLKVIEGGTRSYGHHLTTAKPSHSVGAYYYLLRSPLVTNRFLKSIGRAFRAVRTRHHLRHPWWIVATLISEVLGFIWAISLIMRGPRLISPTALATDKQ